MAKKASFNSVKASFNALEGDDETDDVRNFGNFSQSSSGVQRVMVASSQPPFINTCQSLIQMSRFITQYKERI